MTWAREVHASGDPNVRGKRLLLGVVQIHRFPSVSSEYFVDRHWAGDPLENFTDFSHSQMTLVQVGALMPDEVTQGVSNLISTSSLIDAKT